MTPLSLPLLANKIGHTCALYRVDGRSGKRVAVDIDPETTKQVHALLAQCARRITCISTTPLIDAEGRLVTRPGLDEPSGVYLDFAPGSVPPIPQEPTHAQTAGALRRAWRPWSAYRWASPHDRAAMLAAVLLVPLRPLIDVAPGFIANAAAEGAGKSKATRAVAALALGHRVSEVSWPMKSEDEAAKLVTTLVREGAGAVVIDNLKGSWDSESLSTALASGQFKGRHLGYSSSIEGPARMLWLASGNHVSLSRDLARRFLVAYIDPGVADPQSLSYAFDPEATALADRDAIVAAILTLHRAWHAAGRPAHDGRDCGFAVWSRTVRAMVAWLQESGIAASVLGADLGDPAHAILTLEASRGDPAAQTDAAIILALHGLFGAAPFETGDVRAAYLEGRNLAERGVSADDADVSQGAAVMLFEALNAIKPDAARSLQGISTQSLSSILWNRKGRRVEMLRIDLVTHNARTKTWRIAAD